MRSLLLLLAATFVLLVCFAFSHPTLAVAESSLDLQYVRGNAAVASHKKTCHSDTSGDEDYVPIDDVTDGSSCTKDKQVLLFQLNLSLASVL